MSRNRRFRDTTGTQGKLWATGHFRIHFGVRGSESTAHQYQQLLWSSLLSLFSVEAEHPKMIFSSKVDIDKHKVLIGFRNVEAPTCGENIGLRSPRAYMHPHLHLATPIQTSWQHVKHRKPGRFEHRDMVNQ